MAGVDEPRPTEPVNRVRRVVLVALLVAGLGAVGAMGAGFVWYDQATRPDRSAPDLVVSHYLRAVLVERDDTRADLFVCAAPELDGLRGLRDEIEQRERAFDVSVRVSWGALTRTRVAADRETVRTEVTIAGVAGAETRSERTETWSFDLVDTDGWRVCGATKVP